MNPLVYIIVLNWNGEDLIADCLDSLSKIKYDNYKIFVVDNNSDDNSKSIIKQKYQFVELLELDKNYGFAEGNNKGFESILDTTDFVIFMNNDTEVDQNFVEPLIQPLVQSPKIGQTVPKIFYFNNKDKIWYAGGKVNFWLGQIKHIGIRKIDSPKHINSTETDYATGCCFAIRYKDFEQIGGFDSTFPMYCEDVDLSLRIQKFGQKVQFIPESKIWHKISVSMGGEFSLLKVIRKFKGYKILFWKHSNILQKFTIPISWLISIPFLIIKFLYLRISRNG